MKRNIGTVLMMAMAGTLLAQSPENATSVKTETTQEAKESSEVTVDAFHRQLQELEVKGESAWIEGNKFVFVPEKRVKRQARSIVDMVELLNTGVLQVTGGSITTNTGQPVTIYINGVQADEIDQSTFWAMNALKVEFMPITDDPRFHGSSNVLNIVMKEYLVGGLTNLEMSGYIPQSASYEVSSKLVYKKMSYNAMVKGNHSYDHLNHSENRETFQDVWYEGQHYDDIEKVEEVRTKSKNNNIHSAINARFRNEKWAITHTASLQWNKDPGSSTFGSLDFTPDIISGNRSWSAFSSRTINPGVSGVYSFIPEGPWNFYAGWWFSYNSNNNHSENQEGAENVILNTSNEDVYDGGLC